ncbi:MAG: hypothetical protein AAB630_02100, partial [Patescibacteria group bacterium]
MANIIFTLAFIVFVVGILAWLFLYLIPPNTIAIPVFLGGERLNHIMQEGLRVYAPFCQTIQYEIGPRPRIPLDISLNVFDDQIKAQGEIGFQLLRPDEMEKKMGDLKIACVEQEKNYLILYDRRQPQLENDARARLKEMLDEQLSRIPAECALSKELNDAVQLAVVKGIKFKEKPDGKTAEQKIIDIVKAYKKNYVEKLLVRGVAATDIPEIPEPSERDLPDHDTNIRGLERIFLEDYGAHLMIATLALEPNADTAKTRSKLRQREIERDIERMDTELVVSQIATLIDTMKA